MSYLKGLREKSRKNESAKIKSFGGHGKDHSSRYCSGGVTKRAHGGRIHKNVAGAVNGITEDMGKNIAEDHGEEADQRGDRVPRGAGGPPKSMVIKVYNNAPPAAPGPMASAGPAPPGAGGPPPPGAGGPMPPGPAVPPVGPMPAPMGAGPMGPGGPGGPPMIPPGIAAQRPFKKGGRVGKWYGGPMGKGPPGGMPGQGGMPPGTVPQSTPGMPPGAIPIPGGHPPPMPAGTPWAGQGGGPHFGAGTTGFGQPLGAGPITGPISLPAQPQAPGGGPPWWEGGVTGFGGARMPPGAQLPPGAMPSYKRGGRIKHHDADGDCDGDGYARGGKVAKKGFGGPLAGQPGGPKKVPPSVAAGLPHKGGGLRTPPQATGIAPPPKNPSAGAPRMPGTGLPQTGFKDGGMVTGPGRRENNMGSTRKRHDPGHAHMSAGSESGPGREQKKHPRELGD